MLHYLTKLGLKPWAKFVAPGCAIGISLTYTYVQVMGHKKIRNFLVAREPSGQNIELSNRLKSLIIETYQDIRPKLADQNPKFKRLYDILPHQSGEIKWFASSTMEPFSVGSTDMRFGCLIGLPAHYNYTKTQDVPDSLIKFKKLRIFKKIFKDSKGDLIDQQTIQSKFDPMDDELKPPWEATIDRNDPIIKNYLDSLILSDDAVRYLVAREIHVVDTNKSIFKTCLAMFSTTFPIALSRLTVRKFGLDKIHVSNRLCIYATVGLATLIYYLIVNDTIERSYGQESHEWAVKLGECYKRGAIEYHEKVLAQNKALNLLFADAREIYDEEGEKREPPFRYCYYKFHDALEFAKNYVEEQEDEMKQKQWYSRLFS